MINIHTENVASIILRLENWKVGELEREKEYFENVFLEIFTGILHLPNNITHA